MKTYTTIFDKIRQERDFFENGSISLIKGKENALNFNQRDTLNRIEFYSNSNYEGSPNDSEGFPKPFFDIVNFPVEVAAKSIDIDTKDFRFLSEEGQSFWPAWYFTREFRVWIKDTWFAKFLNEIKDDLPRYGSVAAKKVGKELHNVNLNRFRCHPAVKWLKDSSFIHEIHYYSPQQVRKFKGWKNVENAITKYKGTEETQMEITEAYGYVPKKFLAAINLEYALTLTKSDNFEEEIPAVFMVYGLDLKDETGGDSGIVLFAEQVEEWPYKDLHWGRVKGRWLGKGEVEKLFEEQMATNEIVYFEKKGLQWASKIIFQTSDSQMARNLLIDVRNGDIMRREKNSEGIQRIDTAERNLPGYRNQFDIWGKNVREKSFSFESTTGETMPSGTPFRLGALLQRAVEGHWSGKREDFGLWLKEIILDDILKEFRKNVQEEHLINFLGDESDLDLVDDKIADNKIKGAVLDILEQGGNLPGEAERMMEKQRIIDNNKKLAKRLVKATKGWYDNYKYKLDLEITGESIDFTSNLETLTNIFTIVSQNPQILQIPILKKAFFRILNLVGISPINFRDLDMPAVAQTPQGGQQMPEERMPAKAMATV